MSKRPPVKAHPRRKRWIATFLLGQLAAFLFAFRLSSLYFAPGHQDAQIAGLNLVLMIWLWLLAFALPDKAFGTPKVRIALAATVILIYGLSALVTNLHVPVVDSCEPIEGEATDARYRCVWDESRVSIFTFEAGDMTMQVIETLE